MTMSQHCSRSRERASEIVVEIRGSTQQLPWSSIHDRPQGHLCWGKDSLAFQMSLDKKLKPVNSWQHRAVGCEGTPKRNPMVIFCSTVSRRRGYAQKFGSRVFLIQIASERLLEVRRCSKRSVYRVRRALRLILRCRLRNHWETLQDFAVRGETLRYATKNGTWLLWRT